jgi:hypothetical protein
VENGLITTTPNRNKKGGYMPLLLKSAPDRVHYLMEQRLKNHSFSVDGSLLQEPALAIPHQVFMLRADDIQGTQSDLERAYPTGWRYLLVDGESIIAAIEVQGVEAKNMRYSHLQQGAAVDSLVKSLEYAEEHSAIAKSNFELRLLRVPAIYFVALWLKSDATGESFLVPLAPAPAGVQEYSLYSPPELCPALHRLIFEVKNNGLPTSGVLI